MMSASQVVLYFDKPEDAIQFTVAASSMLAADESSQPEALLKVAQEISKARRIRTEAGSSETPDVRQDRCA